MEAATKQADKSFHDLRVWQSAYQLATGVCKLCEAFPRHGQYALNGQMERAAISICSNIAEGFGRKTAKKKDQSNGTANGSLTELENQLLIAHGIGYISRHNVQSLADLRAATHKMLYVLQKASRKNI